MRSLWCLFRWPFDIIKDTFYQVLSCFICRIIIKTANTSIKRGNITAISVTLIILSNNIPKILAIIKIIDVKSNRDILWLSYTISKSRLIILDNRKVSHMLPDMVLTTSTMALITLSFIPALASMSATSPTTADSMIADIIYVITIFLFILSRGTWLYYIYYKFIQFKIIDMTATSSLCNIFSFCHIA